MNPATTIPKGDDDDDDDDDDHIYDDLDTVELPRLRLERVERELAESQATQRRLTAEGEALRKTRRVLTRQTATLLRNISILFKTAVAEISRKDAVILELREAVASHAQGERASREAEAAVAASAAALRSRASSPAKQDALSPQRRGTKRRRDAPSSTSTTGGKHTRASASRTKVMR